MMDFPSGDGWVLAIGGGSIAKSERKAKRPGGTFNGAAVGMTFGGLDDEARKATPAPTWPFGGPAGKGDATG